MRELHRWVAAKFDGRPAARATAMGPGCADQLRRVMPQFTDGRQLVIGKSEYARGYSATLQQVGRAACPLRARTFSAVVGVDSNSQTRGGRGSDVFSSLSGGKRRSARPVMREGTLAERVSLDLAGATEFLLEVSDAGDGIACDQAGLGGCEDRIGRRRILWLVICRLLRGRCLRRRPRICPSRSSYDGRPSAALLPEWRLDRQVRKLDDRRTDEPGPGPTQNRVRGPLGGGGVPRFSRPSNGRCTSRTAGE